MTESSPSEADRIIIGKAGAPHGVKGEVRIIVLTDFPERFDDLREVMVGEKNFRVENTRRHKNGIIVKFAGCDDRDGAARLTGKLLTVARGETFPLAEGEYYTFDIIGLRVFDENDAALGVVTEVLRTGSNDVYAVKNDDGKEILVPALKKIVRKIDVANGRMTVALPKEY